MKKSVIRGISMLLVLMTAIAAFSLPASAEDTIAEPACQRQWVDEWKSVYYGTDNRGSLYDTGCGIFSFANAVYYLTGNNPDIETVSAWAASVNALNGTFGGGLVRGIFYANVEAEFGARYGFTVPNTEGTWADWSSTDLKNHVKSGEVAIGHVPNHFIAIVGYDEVTDQFLVYDSAPSASRGTNVNDGKVWLTEAQLTSRTKSTLDWYCKLQRTGAVPAWYENAPEPSADLGVSFDATIKAVSANRLLGVSGNTPGKVEGSGNEPTAQWSFTRNADGSYTISSVYNHKALDVESTDVQSKPRVRMRAENKSDSQKWYIYEVAGGYTLRPKCALDAALDCENEHLQIWTCNEGEHQVFAIQKLTATSTLAGTSASSDSASSTDDPTAGTGFFSKIGKPVVVAIGAGVLAAMLTTTCVVIAVKKKKKKRSS